MSTLKFLTKNLATGFTDLVSALVSSSGVGDANKIIATDGSGKLDPTLLPPGIDLAVESILASEGLNAGDYVNIYDNASVRNIRKADASLGRPAHGFVLTGVTNGNNGNVYVTGVNNQVSGLTAGNRIFLSATVPGRGTATPPAQTSGYICQVLGVATSDSSVRFEYDDPIYIA